MSWREAVSGGVDLAPDAPIWTSLGRRCGTPAWPADLPRGETIVWQAYPERIWIASESSGTDGGWRRDTVMRDGRPTDLPAPSPQTALAVMRGLKDVFDPGRARPTPPWLEARP